MLLSKDSSKLRVFLNGANDIMLIFVMCFISSRCKMLVQDGTGPKPSLALTGEKLDEGVNLVTWVVVSHLLVDVSSGKQKAPLAFANFKPS